MSTARDWHDFARAHEPDRRDWTHAELRDELEVLEMELDRAERYKKHAGTRRALEGAERRIDALEDSVLATKKRLGGRSSVGSVYGTVPGQREGRIAPPGARGFCQCGAPMTGKEGFEGAGWCPECVRDETWRTNRNQEERQ